jgi:uncharacterized protein (TIGR03435 family)
MWIALCAPGILSQGALAPKMIVPDSKVPSYDVVSIKPNKTGSGNVDISIDDGNFDAVNVSLKSMLLNAYGLKDAQLVNLPKWGESARFDIKAKIIEPDKKLLEALSNQQFRSMQQPILTERFHLKFHREMKTLPVYELVVAKDGPKFKGTSAAEMSSDQGVNGVRAGGINIRNQNLTATGIPMLSIADTLSDQVQRVVVDKTGLTGKYNLQLRWSRDDAGPPAAETAAPPDLFTALREQLGLKLQASKAEIETFVIDQVVMPDVD